MTNPAVEARLDRLESLFSSAGEMLLKTSDIAQQHDQQIHNLERLITSTAELAQQNAQQITRLERSIDQNTQQMAGLERTMAQLALQAVSDRAEFEAFRRTTQAALEKIDRVLDYLMQRDNPQSEDN